MAVYPALVYPECYLLHLGYKEFYKHYPELCTGRYTEMVDPRHKVGTVSLFKSLESVQSFFSEIKQPFTCSG